MSKYKEVTEQLISDVVIVLHRKGLISTSTKYLVATALTETLVVKPKTALEVLKEVE